MWLEWVICCPNVYDYVEMGNKVQMHLINRPKDNSVNFTPSCQIKLFNESPKEQVAKLNNLRKPECSRRLHISLLDGFLPIIKGVSGTVFKDL